MRAPRSDRPAGADQAHEAADSAPEAARGPGTALVLTPAVTTGAPAWAALARLLRARKPNEVDAAIEAAIDAVTEVR